MIIPVYPPHSPFFQSLKNFLFCYFLFCYFWLFFISLLTASHPFHFFISQAVGKTASACPSHLLAKSLAGQRSALKFPSLISGTTCAEPAPRTPQRICWLLLLWVHTTKKLATAFKKPTPSWVHTVNSNWRLYKHAPKVNTALIHRGYWYLKCQMWMFLWGICSPKCCGNLKSLHMSCMDPSISQIWALCLKAIPQNGTFWGSGWALKKFGLTSPNSR